MMSYWILFIGIAVASWLVQANLQRKFKKYSKIPTGNGMTGRDVAMKMLHDNGINDVKVTHTPGTLTDHYNPATKTVNLSEGVYESNSIMAAAVAAHECGHAVQHARAYAPEGEDIQIFERDLPGENASGLSGQDVSPLPLETCETMNGMWGYKITDANYKSVQTLIHYLVKAAGKNANLLMNIGPQPDGELPEVAVQRLRELGAWMADYGETIQGTRGGMIPPHDWGVTTQKGDTLYVHILNLQDKALFLPLTERKVKKATLFKDKSPLRFTRSKDGILLELKAVPTNIDCVVELTLG